MLCAGTDRDDRAIFDGVDGFVFVTICVDLVFIMITVKVVISFWDLELDL